MKKEKKLEINDIDSLDSFMDGMEAFGADKMSVTFDVKRHPYESFRINVKIEKIENEESIRSVNCGNETSDN